MRKFLFAVLTGATVAGVLIACGGDDTNGTTVTTSPDSGVVVTIMPDGNVITTGPDTGTTPPDDGSTTTDAGSGCKFTDFVLNEVQNETNGTSAPVPGAMIPDPTCSETGNPTPFSALF